MLGKDESISLQGGMLFLRLFKNKEKKVLDIIYKYI